MSNTETVRSTVKSPLFLSSFFRQYDSVATIIIMDESTSRDIAMFQVSIYDSSQVNAVNISCDVELFHKLKNYFSFKQVIFDTVDQLVQHVEYNHHQLLSNRAKGHDPLTDVHDDYGLTCHYETFEAHLD